MNNKRGYYIYIYVYTSNTNKPSSRYFTAEVRIERTKVQRMQQRGVKPTRNFKEEEVEEEEEDS